MPIIRVGGHDDLDDSFASLEWATAQIPLMQQGFIEWQRSNPYPVIEEVDPERGGKVAVVYDQPFPLTFNVWVGVIINGLRSALDLAAAALAIRNGKSPNADTHFPIFRSIHELVDPLTGIKSKKWLSPRERAAIESFNPYDGGDKVLWPLHRLDILRKHQRLVIAKPQIDGYLMVGGRRLVVGGAKAIQRMKNKTVLFQLAPGEILNATQGNTLLAVFITFNETGLGLGDHEVAAVLREFADRVTDILCDIDRL